MEYKTITKPDGSEQKLAVYDGKCRFWMEGLYDSLPDTQDPNVLGRIYTLLSY